MPRLEMLLEESRIGRPRKSLGQNFLSSPDVAARIVDEAVRGNEGLIFEIGPGRGALTLILAQRRVRTVAIEIDGELVEYLRGKLDGLGAVEVVHADIRNFDLDREARLRGCEEYRVVGNIPYHLTGTILLETAFLQGCAGSVLMVQREVAERVMAAPGTKKCGILSVFLQSYFEVEKIMAVRPGAFFPRPKVKSIVIALVPAIRDGAPTNRRAFLDLLKLAFSQRRKKLGSVLRDLFGMGDAGTLSRLAEATGASMDERPEGLTLAQWKRLFEATKRGSGS